MAQAASVWPAVELPARMHATRCELAGPMPGTEQRVSCFIAASAKGATSRVLHPPTFFTASRNSSSGGGTMERRSAPSCMRCALHSGRNSTIRSCTHRDSSSLSTPGSRPRLVWEGPRRRRTRADRGAARSRLAGGGRAPWRCAAPSCPQTRPARSSAPGQRGTWAAGRRAAARRSSTACRQRCRWPSTWSAGQTESSSSNAGGGGRMQWEAASKQRWQSTKCCWAATRWGPGHTCQH